MCTVLLPPGDNRIAVNKYIISYLLQNRLRLLKGVKKHIVTKKHFINHTPQGGLRSPHATKNVHKPWNEGRVLFICDTAVCMITHPTNRAVMARDDPLLC